MHSISSIESVPMDAAANSTNPPLSERLTQSLRTGDQVPETTLAEWDDEGVYVYQAKAFVKDVGGVNVKYPCDKRLHAQGAQPWGFHSPKVEIGGILKMFGDFLKMKV